LFLETMVTMKLHFLDKGKGNDPKVRLYRCVHKLIRVECMYWSDREVCVLV